MGCQKVDTTGESVFSSKLKESLISVAVLMEAGFDVVFRIPYGVGPVLHPNYGGHITTPDSRQVMMIYYDKTWRLPQKASLPQSRPPPLRFHEFLNPFASLAQYTQDDDDNNDEDNMASPLLDASEHTDMSEVEQRRFEILMNRQAEVQNLHYSFGHPNNQALLQHCQHAKIGTKYLQRYYSILRTRFLSGSFGTANLYQKTAGRSSFAYRLHSSATNYRSRRCFAPFQGITFESYRSLSIGTSNHHRGFI
jgi:hypothetical protein